MKSNRFSLKTVILIGMFVALQVILARFVSIPVSDGLRLSFETIPIFLAGFWLGPVAGMIVGALSDILGALLFPFGPYFPLLTLGPVILGCLAGLGGAALSKLELTEWKSCWKLFVLVILAETANSILYGTWALTLYYSMILSKDMPFLVLLAARLPGKAVTIALDCILVFLLHKTLYQRVFLKYREEADK